MLSDKIKRFRNELGYSQEKLAEKAEISLRTIQRLENEKSEPRGDTLIRIAKALDISVDDLIDWKKDEDRSYLTLLHLSALSYLLFPLLGVVIPLVLWIAKKGKIKELDKNARQLLSFQITWTILLFSAFISYLIWWNYKSSAITEISTSIISDFTIPFYTIFGALYAFNLIVIVYNAFLVSSGRKVWYNPRINFLS
jgi:transcriptional regulator with XRE-family HTH domain